MAPEGVAQADAQSAALSRYVIAELVSLPDRELRRLDPRILDFLAALLE